MFVGEDDVIRRFYAASAGQADWDIGFAGILELTGFEGSAFYVIDRQRRMPLVEHWHRLDTQYAAAYLKDYLAIDPRGAQVFAPGAPRILYDYLHTPEEAMDTHPFYSWMEQTQGTRYYVGGQSGPEAQHPVTLTLHRSRRRGHANDAELSCFQRLFDHFEAAVRLQHAVKLDTTREAASLAALEEAPHGVLLLDAAGAVLHANAAASRIGARGDGLSVSRAGLSAASRGDDTALTGRLAGAAGGKVQKPVLIARSFGGHPYIVTITAIPGVAPLLKVGCAAFVVRIFDPDACAAVSLARAAPLLGLSRQETRLLELLLAGYEPPDIATLLRLKAATIRSYLAALYRKTGMSGQASLINYAESIRRFLG